MSHCALCKFTYLQSNFLHFQSTSAPPFHNSWQLTADSAQCLTLFRPDVFFYIWPSFCVAWLWSLLIMQHYETDTEARQVQSYRGLIFFYCTLQAAWVDQISWMLCSILLLKAIKALDCMWLWCYVMWLYYRQHKLISRWLRSKSVLHWHNSLMKETLTPSHQVCHLLYGFTFSSSGIYVYFTSVRGATW